nr:MAG TPA: hypothetical protein [Caudoviricetes sp.]
MWLQNWLHVVTLFLLILSQPSNINALLGYTFGYTFAMKL